MLVAILGIGDKWVASMMAVLALKELTFWCKTGNKEIFFKKKKHFIRFIVLVFVKFCVFLQMRVSSNLKSFFFSLIGILLELT